MWRKKSKDQINSLPVRPVRLEDVYSFLDTEKTIILCPHCDGEGKCGCFSCSNTWHWISSICQLCKGMKLIKLKLPELNIIEKADIS